MSDNLRDGGTGAGRSGSPGPGVTPGKDVKISISLAQLQSFRRDRNQVKDIKKGKIQRILPPPSPPGTAHTRIQNIPSGVGEGISFPIPNFGVPDAVLAEADLTNRDHPSGPGDEDEDPVILDDGKDLGGKTPSVGQVPVLVGAIDQASAADTVPTNEDLGPVKEGGTNKNVIRPIDRGVVHQICSGQVIVTLSTAVKELVENSLDAGATKIDIRLIEHGSKLIEVADDGSGIEETNFEGLALKHHTSKITEFEDLGTLSTFGFRGEALSSLCALSNLTVTTRHQENDEKIGHKIEYSNSGRISTKTRCAREHGTTISLKDLFHTLPVRHREFLKNLKREFHRTVNILYGYCLVASVRITCTNQVGNGGATKVLAVPAYHSMKERIVALFGSKQFSQLIEIKPSDDVPEEILSEFGLNEQSYSRKYELEGYISQPNHGRSSSDRQFYFINSRPCDPAKISRVVNEIYHTFSRSQNPLVCLHIKTNKENVDVNVTPDKRTVYVQNEKILLATLKAALVPLLTSAASSFSDATSLSQSQLTFTGQSQVPSQSQGDNTEIDHADNSVETESDKESQLGFARQYSTPGTSKQHSSVINKTNAFIKRVTQGFGAGNKQDITGYKRPRNFEGSSTSEGSKQPKLSGFLRKYGATEKESISGTDRDRDREKSENMDYESDEKMDEDDCTAGSVYESENYDSNCKDPKDKAENEDDDDEVIIYDDDSSYGTSENIKKDSKSVSIKVNWKEVANFSSKLRSNDDSTTVSFARRFRAKINPEDNKTAEEELKKQLSKDMFRQMQIHGQFNLGFIIARNGPDLFIVDQHASDEKYNYEDLEKTTVLQGQLLIRPLDLELPAISENIIIDNVKAFQRNGFDFIISPDELPTKRVKLSKIPYSKNTEFDKSDLEELVFMMEDASEDSFYRPTKVRQMLASRACRKSVMIGTALSPKEMRVIVDHMSEMEQPWNCPHGRPTIRHLINLNLLPDLDNIKFNH